MSAKIGVLVHSRHQETFRRAARAVSGADLRWATYEHPAQAGERLRVLTADDHLDGLLVDPEAAEFVRSHEPAALSIAVVRHSALELAIALAHARAEQPAARSISVDGFDPADVDEVTAELGTPTSTLPSGPEAPVTDVLAHHRKTLRDGGVAITSRPEAREQLRADGTVVTAELSPGSIRTVLRELLLRVDGEQAAAMRFGAAVFQVRDGPDVDAARAGLRELLLHDAALSGVWVEQRGRRGLVVFAHQALLRRATDEWRVVPALREAEERHGIRAVAGFGIGPSVRSGISLADRAAARAESENRSCAFLIQDNGAIIGPIDGDYRRTTFVYRDHGQNVQRMAAEIGLSPTTLSRLVALERDVGGRALTPSELAALLGITDPSGRRLIRKLQSADLVSAEGSAQPNRRGRPTRLYRLRLTDVLGPPA